MKSCRTCQASYPSDFTVCPQDATPLIEIGTWAEGAVVRGKFRILCKIGQGGFGAVYKAQHVRFDELRALKVITPERANDPSLVKRFYHEAVITRKFQHPNAVRVEDVDEAEDGSPFIVMEYLQGRSLRSLLRDEGRLPVPRVCSLATQAALALGAAHNLNILHRDIKPDNIFIVNGSEGEQVKVLDFGIAKAQEGSLGSAGDLTQTKTGMIVGTAQYMSPEQAMGMRGDELDGRSDLYSLGVVMYEMLSGDPPFRADTTMGILMAHIHEPPPPIRALHPELQISENIERLVMGLLQKKREARPASADDLIKEIERAVAAPGPQLVSTLIVMPTEIVSDLRGENRPGQVEPGNRAEVPLSFRPAVVPPALADSPLPTAAPAQAPPAAQQPKGTGRVESTLPSRASAPVQASGSRRSLSVWTKWLLFPLVAVSLLRVYIALHPKTPAEPPGETDLHEPILLQPNDPFAHQNLALDLLSKHDWDGAISELRTCVQLSPREETHGPTALHIESEDHGVLKERLRDTDFGGAIPALRQRIKDSPNDAILHDLLGMALESTKQRQAGAAEYRRAFELDPKNGDYQSDYEGLR